MAKLKWLLVEEKLRHLGLKIFTANELSQIFDSSKRASHAFLAYNTKRGGLLRLRKGYYAFKNYLPHDFLIANKIYQPSYVSLETALSFYALIPETIYSVTSITTRKTAHFSVNNKRYIYHHIKPSAFTGYLTTRVNGEMVYLALPEKAVADFCYFVFLKKKKWNERLKKENLNQTKLVHYLEMLAGKKLVDFWLQLGKKNG